MTTEYTTEHVFSPECLLYDQWELLMDYLEETGVANSLSIYHRKIDTENPKQELKIYKHPARFVKEAELDKDDQKDFLRNFDKDSIYLCVSFNGELIGIVKKTKNEILEMM